MKILVSDDVNEQGVALLREHYDVDVKTNLPPEELLKVIGEYDGLVTRSQTQVTQEVIDAATNLKVIGRAGVGVDNINIPAATARGIVVVNAPDSNTVAAAEHTIGMMLAMTRHIPQAHQSIQEGKWDRKSFYRYPTARQNRRHYRDWPRRRPRSQTTGSYGNDRAGL